MYSFLRKYKSSSYFNVQLYLFFYLVHNIHGLVCLQKANTEETKMVAEKVETAVVECKVSFKNLVCLFFVPVLRIPFDFLLTENRKCPWRIRK